MTTLPTRRIQIEGAYNVRDLGGYETTDGRYTKWKMFIRGDDVSTLPRSSQDVLTDFGVRTVIDLRGVDRKSVVEGKSVDIGGVRRLNRKK